MNETDILYSFGIQPEVYPMIDSVYLVLSNVVALGLVMAAAIPSILLMYIVSEIRRNPNIIFSEDSYSMVLLDALSYDEYMDIEKMEDILKEHQKDIFNLFLKVLVLALLTQSALAVGVVTVFYAMMFNLDPFILKYYAATYWQEEAV